MSQYDNEEEVITMGGSADDVNNGTEDRGDIVDPELTRENLKALAEQATDDDEPTPTDKPSTDATPEANADAEDHADTRGARIPKARFDEVNEARKEAQRAAEEARARAEELERELAALRAPKPAAEPAAPAAPAFDEAAKESEYIEALMEGDGKKAAAIRAEINAHLRQSAANEAAERTRLENERASAEATQKAVASALQAESALALQNFPYLDTPEGAEALDLILASRDAKIARGMAPHLALREAVEKIAPKFAPDGDAPPTSASTNGKPRGDTRSANAVARGAEDSNLQPPSVQAGIGNRATAARINVEAMSEEQFSNLSAEDKRRLRGD